MGSGGSSWVGVALRVCCGREEASSSVLTQQAMLGRLVRMVEVGGQGGPLACCLQEEGSLLWRLARC